MPRSAARFTNADGALRASGPCTFEYMLWPCKCASGDLVILTSRSSWDGIQINDWSEAMSNKFYVYFLLDPRKEYLPYYIGKGTGNRAKRHITRKTDKFCWLKQRVTDAIRRAGYEPTILIWADNLSEEDAYNLEIEQISRFGRIGFDRDGILTNRTAGGDGTRGMSVKPETRAKIRQSLLGRKASAEHRAAQSAAKKGRRLPATPKRIEAAMSNLIKAASVPYTAERRAKMGAATVRTHTGMKRSDAARQRMSEAMQGKRRGVPKSPEQRAKMSEAQRIRRMREREGTQQV